ncbi:MAG: hypothetical protein CVT61_01880 [Actinobacteria bacterium HGW-Actinobacteria-11]|nr:MAG: hypothetical protein CVT61_01880 [Actinobacteria bacterium HGW-Actinobacteria-11]
MTVIETRPDTGAIKKPLLADLVFDRLLAGIISGRFRPDQRLQVDALAEELGVSRTPIREALARLTWTRFVDVARNSHTQVAEWDASDMRDRLEVVGRLACFVVSDPRLNVADIVDDIAPDPLMATGSTNDVQAFLAFAERIVHAGVNRVARYTLSELTGPLRMFYVPDVLGGHSVDLTVGEPYRVHHLNRAFAAAHRGDATTLERHLAAYIHRLAGATAPRESDGNPADAPEAVTAGVTLASARRADTKGNTE